MGATCALTCPPAPKTRHNSTSNISVNYKAKTGVLKDGTYSAVFSFLMKSVGGLGMFINGWLMELVGFMAGFSTQAPEVVHRMAILTFVSGPVVVLLSLPIMMAYPINRAFMMGIKKQLEAQAP